MKIGILGGAFDPIHKGHLCLARAALREGRLDTVYLVPTGRPPHKRPPQANTDTRCRMIQKAIRGIRGLRLSRIEIESRGISYTYKTLRRFRKMFPRDQFFLVVGSDHLKKILRWKNVKEIFREVFGILIGQRPGLSVRLPRPILGKAVFLKTRLPEVSSSYLRRSLRLGKKRPYA